MTQMNEYKSVWSYMMQTPFRQDWVDVGGMRTRFVQAGRTGKPALIMVHGTAGSWETFCANIPAYVEDFDCYALDLIGSGFTAKPDVPYSIPRYVEHLLAFMNALGIAKASFIGVSLGAWIAARFAHSHPDRTEKIILLAAVGLATNLPPTTTTNAIQVRRGRAVNDPSWENISEIFAGLILDERKRMPDFIKIRQSVYLQPEMKESMERTLQITTPEAFGRDALNEAEWFAIEAPALVVEATGDQDFYIRTARRLPEIMRKASVLRMENVGHWAHFEDHETFNRASLAFLKN